MKITYQILDELATAHIARYETYLARAREGHRGYNTLELSMLLRLWKNIKNKKLCIAKRFTAEERNEIQDAFFDEFDQHLEW